MTIPLERVVTTGRQTEDQLMRDMLASTASFINCVNGTDGDNPTEITRADVDTVVRTLRGNNASRKSLGHSKLLVIDLEVLKAA